MIGENKFMYKAKISPQNFFKVFPKYSKILLRFSKNLQDFFNGFPRFYQVLSKISSSFSLDFSKVCPRFFQDKFMYKAKF
jgi:hypothetical protein